MEFFTAGKLLVGLVSVLATYSIWRLNRSHQETLAALNHAYSKEAHAANHLYTRKASHLEKASEIVGDLKFWAEKCVVSRTRTDFGNKEIIASNMSQAFEDLSLHAMKYPFVFEGIQDFYGTMNKLVGCVNFIENMANSKDFSSDAKAWKDAVERFQTELSPLAQAVQDEINRVMEEI